MSYLKDSEYTIVNPGIFNGKILCIDEKPNMDFIGKDKVIVINNLEYLPLKDLSNVKGILSYNYTGYSHLASIACMLNIPCIVGINKSVRLKDGDHINIHINNVNYNTKIVNSRLKHTEKLWLQTMFTRNINKEKISSVSGIFIDASIVRIQSVKTVILDIKKILLSSPEISIGFRFSRNYGKTDGERFDSTEYINGSILDEIELVTELLESGIKVKIFFPLLRSSSDVYLFKSFVNLHFSKFTREKILVGAMIETRKAIENINIIISAKLLDFVVIGMNDLMSDYFHLQRDDSKNQKKFSIKDENFQLDLENMNSFLIKSGIETFISYPKYNNLVDDLNLLRELGFKNYYAGSAAFDW